MLTIPDQLRTLLTSRFDMLESQLEDDRRLAELDFDSLALLELSVACYEDLGIEVGDTELNGNMRLSELSSLVSARLEAR
ncbi:acyl carrier protein [Streptomyces sp. NPDC001744]|uniref:acyl carrier protein n=1 Tax=Streptomyces sp. NPDC001744 TaxID=3364606 RepID=UPI0036ABBF86